MSGFRILHLRASNFVGGPEQQLLRYAQSERDGTYEVILASFVSGTREGSDFLRAAEARGISVFSFPTRNFGPCSAMNTLVRELRSNKIDLLCTHGFKADILGILAGRCARVPVACFLRGWTRENGKVRVYEAADRFVLRFADRVVCLSQTQAIKLSSQATLAKKIRVVRNAIDIPDIDNTCKISAHGEVRRRYGLPQPSIVVATAGRLSPEKGTHDFLLACSMLRRAFPDARFLVFGDGVLREQLHLQGQRLGIQNHLKFVGFERELRRLLPGIDLLVNPSHSEELPNIVLEGMAAGIPVVATAVGALEEISGPERAVHLIPPGKPELLAAAIREILLDSQYANNLATTGRRRAELVYSLAEQRRQLHALYGEFIDSSEPFACQAFEETQNSAVSERRV